MQIWKCKTLNFEKNKLENFLKIIRRMNYFAMNISPQMKLIEVAVCILCSTYFYISGFERRYFIGSA